MKATGTDTMKNEIKYEKSELELMTTYQLREICRREKIMNGVIHPLDKEELIQTIMRYMGKRQDFFICDRKKGGSICCIHNRTFRTTGSGRERKPC